MSSAKRSFAWERTYVLWVAQSGALLGERSASPLLGSGLRPWERFAMG